MSDNKLVKSAGEHWVCSLMSRKGWGVALTRDGLERTDILAVDAVADERRLIEVQVKTCSGDDERANWPLGLKAQAAARSENEWFVFVALGDSTSMAPRSFVVPRDHVAAAAWISHMHWLTEPGIAPGKRNAGIDSARVYLWVFAEYEDRWDLMEGPSDECPVLLPSEFHGYATEARVGLPPGHPWRVQLPAW